MGRNSDEVSVKDCCQIIGMLREEVDDHLDAINQNTSEIANNFGYIASLETKMDKLVERLDRLQLTVENHLGLPSVEKVDFSVLPLTKREQEVFLVLYTQEESGQVTHESLARAASLPVELVKEYVTSMIGKGVPIIQKGVLGKLVLSLDPLFKAIQAKENVIGLQQVGLQMVS